MRICDLVLNRLAVGVLLVNLSWIIGLLYTSRHLGSWVRAWRAWLVLNPGTKEEPDRLQARLDLLGGHLILRL